LYLLRHGKADWPEWERPDDERPLNDEGIDEMHQVAPAFKCMKVKPALILSSPLPRALMTAKIAAETLDTPLETRTELEPGFGRKECDALIAAAPGGEDLMIVGHEPDFSTVIRSLTGGRVKLSKAAIAAIELPGEDAPAARLLWLFPPKMLIRLYR
jgi:phosphohistidine phosphatase